MVLLSIGTGAQMCKVCRRMCGGLVSLGSRGLAELATGEREDARTTQQKGNRD